MSGGAEREMPGASSTVADVLGAQREGRALAQAEHGRHEAALRRLAEPLPSNIRGFTRALWRGTTNVNPRTGAEMGVSFDLGDGSIARLMLFVEDARKLAESILYYLEPGTNSHSPISSGAPSVEVSMPDECSKQ